MEGDRGIVFDKERRVEIGDMLGLRSASSSSIQTKRQMFWQSDDHDGCFSLVTVLRDQCQVRLPS